jgi:HK97 family phage prohead protease
MNVNRKGGPMGAKRQMRPLQERRDVAGKVEIREAGSGGLSLTGYASVTNTPYPIQDFMGEFQETIRTGAFAKSVAERDDVRLLLNHDGAPLARTKSGTMTLAEDSTGLLVDAPQLDGASPLVQTIRSAMNRGDLDEMSFGFQVMRQDWSPDYSQRDILEVKLFDVSVVTFPANDATSASLRSALRSAGPGIRRQVGEARIAAAVRELRVGAVLSADTLSVLQQTLDLIAAADEAVDQAQPLLADLMGVPNPDDDDPDADEDDQDDDLVEDDPTPVVEPGADQTNSAAAYEHMQLRRRALEDGLIA